MFQTISAKEALMLEVKKCRQVGWNVRSIGDSYVPQGILSMFSALERYPILVESIRYVWEESGSFFW